MGTFSGEVAGGGFNVGVECVDCFVDAGVDEVADFGTVA